MEKLGYTEVGILKIIGSCLATSKSGKYALIQRVLDGRPGKNDLRFEVIDLQKMVSQYVANGSAGKIIVKDFDAEGSISRAFFSKCGNFISVVEQVGYMYSLYYRFIKYNIFKEEFPEEKLMSVGNACLREEEVRFGMKKKPLFLEDRNFSLYMTDFRSGKKFVKLVLSDCDGKNIYKGNIPFIGGNSVSPTVSITANHKFIFIVSTVKERDEFYTNVLVFMKRGKLKKKLHKTLARKFLSDTLVRCERY